ncbi:hypothetical protein ES705_34224 [subsurface metagenome]
MTKERLSKLQKYILSNCENKSITWNDALSGFYNIEGIKLKMYELKEGTLDKREKRKELKKLSAKLNRIKESVAIAFNQLYLKKLVKRKWDKDKWLDIDEQIQEYIAFCDSKIEDCRESLKESKDNILMKCTLVNYLNKKYDLINGLEIVSSKEYNKIAKEHKAKGSLVLIGSEMCYHVYPSEIIKREIKQTSRVVFNK